MSSSRPADSLLPRFALLSLLLLSCACRTVSGPTPLIWQVSGERNDIYLLGSMHVLRPDDYPLPAPFASSYLDAEQLVMELDLDDLQPADIQRAMGELGIDPERRTLAELMGEAAWSRALGAAEKIDIDLRTFQAYEPWVVSLLVVDLQMQRLGFKVEHGIEAHYVDRARADGKSITGLETVDQQFAFFDQMPLAVQREFLLKSIEDAQQVPQRMDALVASWKNGDELFLQRELVDSFADFPELYDALVSERNERWTGEIEKLASTDDDVLVIVGALHLVGEDSVVARLRQRGYVVRRFSD
ncbi:MAG: TraB/GumN family protein [Gammaproteobacteria bacterium]|nr:TraB/GumN family protein [Gammaproteobacteria bacterium]